MIPPNIIPKSHETHTTVNNLNPEKSKKDEFPFKCKKIILDTFEASKIHIGYRKKWQEHEINSLLEFSKSKPFNNWEDLTTQWNVIAEKNGFPPRNSKGIMNLLIRLKNRDKQSSVSFENHTTVNNSNSEENKKEDISLNCQKIRFNKIKSARLSDYRREWEEDEIKSFVVFLDSYEEFDNWKDLTTKWNDIAKAKSFPERTYKGIEHKFKRLQNPSDKLNSFIEPSSLKKIKFASKDKDIIVKPLDMYNLQSTQSEIDAQDLPPSIECELDNLRKNVPDMVTNLPKSK